MLLLLNLLPAFRGAKEVEGSVECSLPAPSRGSLSAAERDGRSSPAWRPTDDFDPPPLFEQVQKQHQFSAAGIK